MRKLQVNDYTALTLYCKSLKYFHVIYIILYCVNILSQYIFNTTAIVIHIHEYIVL